MSFSKTISAVAALASIFGVSVAGYKLAESSANNIQPTLEEKIIQLEKQLEEVKTQKPVVEVVQPQPVVSPAPVILPPATPPPPVPETLTEQ
jgi:cell division protein FtsX